MKCGDGGGNVRNEKEEEQIIGSIVLRFGWSEKEVGESGK